MPLFTSGLSNPTLCSLYPGYSQIVTQIFTPLYPGFLHPRTPDIHTLLPRISIPSYPGYSYRIFTPLVFQIFTPSYSRYSHPRNPDIHTSYPGYSHRIFAPSYPGYSPLVPRIFTTLTPDIHHSYPGYSPGCSMSRKIELYVHPERNHHGNRTAGGEYSPDGHQNSALH